MVKTCKNLWVSGSDFPLNQSSEISWNIVNELQSGIVDGFTLQWQLESTVDVDVPEVRLVFCERRPLGFPLGSKGNILHLYNVRPPFDS